MSFSKITAVNIKKEYSYMIFPLIGFLVGWRLDRMEDERMSMFRDKSALYKRDTPPDVPSW